MKWVATAPAIPVTPAATPAVPVIAIPTIKPTPNVGTQAATDMIVPVTPIVPAAPPVPMNIADVTPPAILVVVFFFSEVVALTPQFSADSQLQHV